MFVGDDTNMNDPLSPLSVPHPIGDRDVDVLSAAPHVAAVRGGMLAWNDAGLPVVLA